MVYDTRKMALIKVIKTIAIYLNVTSQRGQLFLD